MTTSYAIGLGARRDVNADDLVDLVRRVAGDLGVALSDSALFTAEIKSTEPGFHDAARQLGLSLTFLPLEALKKRRGAAKTHSPRVQAMFGVGSVSEAAALVGAGTGSRLLAPRQSTPTAACAIATRIFDITENGG
jgi:cobalamin biosynthesis protein CbiG